MYNDFLDCRRKVKEGELLQKFWMSFLEMLELLLNIIYVIGVGYWELFLDIFLIYINDLTEGLSSNAKLFAGVTSLFSVIHDSNTSALELNNILIKINRWAFQWKMSLK